MSNAKAVQRSTDAVPRMYRSLLISTKTAEDTSQEKLRAHQERAVSAQVVQEPCNLIRPVEVVIVRVETNGGSGKTARRGRDPRPLGLKRVRFPHLLCVTIQAFLIPGPVK
jgi:hypothetical protein